MEKRIEAEAVVHRPISSIGEISPLDIAPGAVDALLQSPRRLGAKRVSDAINQLQVVERNRHGMALDERPFIFDEEWDAPRQEARLRLTRLGVAPDEYHDVFGLSTFPKEALYLVGRLSALSAVAVDAHMDTPLLAEVTGHQRFGARSVLCAMTLAADWAIAGPKRNDRDR